VRFATQPAALAGGNLRTTAVRSWGAGTEAVVMNYDELAFERFRSASDVSAAEITPMTLEDIFIAVTGEGAPS